ncbi:MAG TPA: SPOR domain-containing protein [Steroidobacteraceae bacterium]|nr:SPOR domain-containing protein [Steroidobacteraceae bacterium]
MTRDYKGRRPGPKSGLSGAAGIAIGIVLGLAVAGFVYLKDRRPAAPPPPAAAPAGSARSARARAARGASRASAIAALPAKSYDFYKILPSFAVVVPNDSREVHRDIRPAPETRPGTYIIQAGSYKHFADADRVRAQLALQGVESTVQKVSVDKDTWHRIRIGPISKLKSLNRIRNILRKAHIHALVIRVGA